MFWLIDVSFCWLKSVGLPKAAVAPLQTTIKKDDKSLEPLPSLYCSSHFSFSPAVKKLCSKENKIS